MESSPRLVSIVIPTYNERPNLRRLVEGVAASARWPFEIIVVDDASPDGTADLALELARTFPIRVISRPGKAGLGSAYRDGFREARGDVIFEMDADLSHDPRYLPALAAAVVAGADIAVGSRYVEGGSVGGWGPYRRLVSHVGNGLARFVLAPGVRDVTSGYRCYARAALPLVQMARSDGYAFQVEVLHLARRAGMVLAEVPIHFENRAVGESKLAAGEFTRFLRTLARLRMARVGASP